MYKKFQSNNSLGGGSSSSGSDGLSDEEDSTLQINLTKCQLTLKKVREFYSKHPNQVTHLLELFEASLDQCVKFLESHDSSTTPLRQLYSTVLHQLQQITTCYDAKLRLYFNKSPIWEYFHRNFREIVQVLRICCQTDRMFERKFVTMPQITVSRNWGVLKTMTISTPSLQKLLPLATAHVVNSSMNRVRSMD